MLVITLMTVLEGAAGVNHLPIPTWGFFLIAFGALLLLLQIVRGIGKGRPHS